MDLSFARTGRFTAVVALPTDLAVLMAVAATRQAAGATARLQVQMAGPVAVRGLLRPADGAFSGTLAMRLNEWKAR